MTEQEWNDLGIVKRLQQIADEVTNDRWRASLYEEIDLLCQAGWGNPVRIPTEPKSVNT